mgnify:CR=1 FL=1
MKAAPYEVPRPPRWENAVLVGSKLHIGTPKTHVSRSVPFPDFLVADVQQAMAGRRQDSPLFGDGLGLDSIDVLEIALVISKKYGFQLKSDNEDNVRIFASLRQQESDADQRQKGEAGEDSEPEHQRIPPATNHVATAATPISMAKA